MGIIADNLPKVEQAINEKVVEMTSVPPREFPQVVSREDSTRHESRVELPIDQTQTVQTTNKQATGELLNKEDGPLDLEFVPLISNEVYSIDVIDETGKPVFTVNAHSGRLGSKVNLPKGRYRYFVRTVSSDMPFSVYHNKGT